MALNRFTSLPKSTIINNQVLTDLGVIDTALQRQQKVYDTQATAIAKTVQDGQKLDFVGEAANGFKAKLNEDLKSFVGEISNQDLADPTIRNKVNGYIQNLSSNPELQKHSLAKKAYDNYEEKKADLDSKGKLHDSNIYAFEKEWNKYMKTGEFNPALTQASIMEGRNPSKEAEEYFDQMKASGGESVAAIKTLAGDPIFYKNGYKALTEGKLKGRAGEVALEWLQSPAAKQLANDWNMMEDKGTKTGFKTPQDYALSVLVNTAKSFAHSDSNSTLSGAMNSKAKADKEDSYAGEGFAPAMNLSTKAEIDSDGRLNLPWYSDAYDAMFGGDSRTPEQLELEKTLKLSKEKSGFKGSLKEFTEQVINTDPNIKVRYYNSDKANKISTQFFNPKTQGGSYINTKVWDEESGKWMAFQDYLKENDITEEQAKNGFTIVGDLSPDNPLTPKGMQAVVAGKSVILDNSASKSAKPLNDVRDRFIHEAARARYNGKGIHTFEFTEPSDGKKYKVTSTLDSNGELNDPEFTLIK